MQQSDVQSGCGLHIRRTRVPYQHHYCDQPKLVYLKSLELRVES